MARADAWRLTGILLLVLPSAVAAGDGRPMETLWANLDKSEIEASRALLELADRPRETVEFLKSKLKPLKLTSGQAKALLLKLGSEEETVWKPAYEELEYLDPRLAIDLPTLMDRYKESPARQRMVEVVSGRPMGSLKGKDVQLRKFGGPDDYNFTADNGSWWAEVRVDRIGTYNWDIGKKKWTRAIRAIVLLQHIGSPDAVEILKDMA